MQNFITDVFRTYDWNDTNRFIVKPVYTSMRFNLKALTEYVRIVTIPEIPGF